MGINGISTNYFQEKYSGNRTTKAAGEQSFSNRLNTKAVDSGKKGITVYMKTDDMLYSGGNGTGLSFYLKYAEYSTDEDPTVIAKGVDENGNEFEQTIHINDINPKCATLVEMRALESYLGVQKRGGLTSLPNPGVGGTGQMGLHDRSDFISMFKRQISDMITLRQNEAAAYYQYSLQRYLDFMGRK